MQIRPQVSEYSSYYATYTNLVSDGNIIHILEQQMKETNLLLKEISDSEGLFRYAPTKWSIKEVMGHIADTERIMAYRLLSIAWNFQAIMMICMFLELLLISNQCKIFLRI
ncbi:hypothetical protein IKC_02437 [Bacillus cereus VD184]|uniref:DinB-like domain-containing protein n=1 Tax=Bacillus cereus VD184 TaxID=1053242 RepID=A0A9W5VSM7_BACCE|nr:hypothetical protein IKC_02437 [Bacillus cereus VD184]